MPGARLNGPGPLTRHEGTAERQLNVNDASVHPKSGPYNEPLFGKGAR